MANLYIRKISSFGRFLSLLFAVLSIFVVVSGYTVYSSIDKLRETDTLRKRTNEIQLATKDLLIDFITVETSVRGYLLSADSSFLKPYDMAVPKIALHIKLLKDTITSSPEQKIRISQVDGMTQEVLSIYKNDIQVRNESGSLPSNEALEQAQLEMDEIRGILNDMQKEEERILINRESLARSNYESIYTSTTLRGIFILVLLFSIYIYVSREILKRRKLTQELVTSESKKDEFMNIASHELKTPVTSLKAYSQVLEQVFKKRNDKLAQSYMVKMHSQINKLTDLINDLLDITKLSAGHLPLNYKKFSFDDLIKEIKEELEITSKNHQIIIKGKTNKYIVTDRDRLGQVAVNLISNAIKYSPKSKKIIITLTTLKKTVQFSVRDYGIGIPKEKVGKVFDRFYRVNENESKSFPGLGLGLYISSEIVKRLGGRISVTSKVNKGSEFFVTLPIEQIA